MGNGERAAPSEPVELFDGAADPAPVDQPLAPPVDQPRAPPLGSAEPPGAFPAEK